MTPAPTPLDVLTRFGRDVLVVSPRGEIDLATAPDLEAILDAVAGRARGPMIIDLADVDFMGAQGFDLISGLAGRLDESGSELVVRSPSALTRRILNLVGLGHLIEAQRSPINTAARAETQRTAEEHAPVVRSLDDIRAASNRARERTIDAALTVVVALAVATVSSADSVSVTLSRRGRLTTAAASDETARQLDVDQYTVGQGPCVHAAASGEQAHVTSTTEETRWPDFVPVAVDAGVTAILSTPLTVNTEPVGALNIYSHGDEGFGADQQELARLIAAQAAGILADDNDELATVERVDRLHDALRTREVIAQAQGILMKRDRITAEDAASTLRRSARQADIPLRALAANIIATTTPPADPTANA